MTQCPQKRSPVYFTVVSTNVTNFHNIWHTVYWSNLQHNNYRHVYVTCVLLLHYLVKYYFFDQFGWFVPSKKLFKCLRNVTMKDFYCCVLPWCWAECWHKRYFIHLCHYCDPDIFQQGSVPAHWLSYCSVKLLSLLVQAYDLHLSQSGWKRRLL